MTMREMETQGAVRLLWPASSDCKLIMLDHVRSILTSPRFGGKSPTR